MSPRVRVWLSFILSIVPLAFAYAGCEVVDGDKKTPFDGSSLNHALVEKKSLVALNALFPNLNVIERTFKGEILTCTDCTERHITCTR
jgi:hypothetical protein